MYSSDVSTVAAHIDIIKLELLGSTVMKQCIEFGVANRHRASLGVGLFFLAAYASGVGFVPILVVKLSASYSASFFLKYGVKCLNYWKQNATSARGILAASYLAQSLEVASSTFLMSIAAQSIVASAMTEEICYPLLQQIIMLVLTRSTICIVSKDMEAWIMNKEAVREYSLKYLFMRNISVIAITKAMAEALQCSGVVEVVYSIATDSVVTSVIQALTQNIAQLSDIDAKLVEDMITQFPEACIRLGTSTLLGRGFDAVQSPALRFAYPAFVSGVASLAGSILNISEICAVAGATARDGVQGIKRRIISGAGANV